MLPQVKETVCGEGGWESSISKLDLYLDLDRYQTVSLQLPVRKQFWLYIAGQWQLSISLVHRFYTIQGKTLTL